jgi:hypothetical protein
MSNQPAIVYLAHPFTGDPGKNIRGVTRIARQIVLASQTRQSVRFYAPLVPHLLLSVYGEETNPNLRQITEAVSCALVRACDELWIVSPQVSAGMKLEVEAAEVAGVRVRQWAEVLELIPQIGTEPQGA